MPDRPRVFVSYVHENLAIVERVVNELRHRGADVWFDKDALPPGVVWREEIRRAVSRHEYFLAFFSREQHTRLRTYMNEELELAIDEIRLRGDAPWFIPIRLSGEIPDIRIGPTRTLRDIQYVDLDAKRLTTGIDTIAGAIGLASGSTRSALHLPTDSAAAVTFTPPDTFELHVRRGERPLHIVRGPGWVITAAAAAVSVAIAVGVRLWPSSSVQPRVNVENALLRPDGMRGPGNDPLLVSAHPDDQDFLLMPELPDFDAANQNPLSKYRLDILDLNTAEHSRIWTHSGVTPRKDGSFPVLVPGAYLKIGNYQLVIYQYVNGVPRELARYTIRIAAGVSELSRNTFKTA